MQHVSTCASNHVFNGVPGCNVTHETKDCEQVDDVAGPAHAVGRSQRHGIAHVTSRNVGLQFKVTPAVDDDDADDVTLKQIIIVEIMSQLFLY